MKLSDNITTDFGSLVTLAFMTFADGEKDSTNFDSMEMELFNIISEIKSGKPYETDYFSQKMMTLHLQSFTAGVIAYQSSQIPIRTIIKKLAQKIVNQATPAEREYCKITFRRFIQMLSKSFNKPELVSIFSGSAISLDLEYQMHNWIMAILAYYKEGLDWKQYFLTCSKILNLLESTKSLKSKEEKAQAAELLITAFIKDTKMQIPQNHLKLAIQVLTTDTSTLPDSDTFAINDIYELGVEKGCSADIYMCMCM